MLKITPEQLEAFKTRPPEGMLELSRQHLKTHLPDYIKGIDPEILDRMIHNALVRGIRRGIRQGEDMIGFVALSFQYGPNFDEQGHIKSLLGQYQNEHTPFLPQVVAKTSDADWKEAQDAYDSSAWFSEANSA